jgi:membrane fusion protein, multidrug efflux system
MTCVVIAVSASACNRGGPDKDNKPAASSKTPTAVSRTPAGDPIVRITPEGQTRIGLQTRAATAHTIEPEVMAFGRLEEDPSRTFLLRAPVAGTLHFAAGRDWPSIGQSLADAAVVGTIEPRLATADRIGLTNQLAAAQSELSASTASVVATRAAYERTKLLNADNKNVSDRALEEAAARLAADEARVKAATDTVRLLERSLDSSGPTGNTPLIVERGGDVVEILARPGEAVEPGAPILRVAKLDRLFARVDVPVGEHVPPTVLAARILPVGYEDAPILADRVGLAATTEPAAQGQSFLFRLRETRLGLRPGLAVTARITVPGPPRRGIVVPSSAIVRLAGKSYVYVQTAANEFVRKEVTLDQPTEGGYLSTRTVAVGERVVVQGAQLLLSEEFKSQIAGDADKG